MTIRNLSRKEFLRKSSMGLAAIGTGMAGLGTIGRTTVADQEPHINEYRVLGRTGFKVSDIGAGLISEEGVLKSALASGINFIDSSESRWMNEGIIGIALKNVDRKSVFLNTKIWVAEGDTADSIVTRMNRFIEKIGTGYLDGMMLWNVNSIKELDNSAFHTAFRQLKEEGKVRYSGMSCHGSEIVSDLKESMEQITCAAAESGRFDLVMFVYNYLQQQMGERILKVCNEKNVGTLLMKTDPFGGYFSQVLKTLEDKKAKDGSLSGNDKIMYDKITRKQEDAKSYFGNNLPGAVELREAAISFVLNHPAVGSTLITFRNYDDVPAVVKLSGSRLTGKKLTLLENVKDSFGNLYCRHACGLCEHVCPHGVPVNTIMRYNHYYMAQSRIAYSTGLYSELPRTKAGNCADCEGFCQKVCPYNVLVQPLLAIAHENLSQFRS